MITSAQLTQADCYID